jgi:hypothetical protein
MNDCQLPCFRRARIEHRCGECGATIKKNDRYRYISGVSDHAPFSAKQCLQCAELFDAACAATERGDDLPAYGMLRDWFFEYRCHGVTDEEFVKDMAALVKRPVSELAKFLE